MPRISSTVLTSLDELSAPTASLNGDALLPCANDTADSWEDGWTRQPPTYQESPSLFQAAHRTRTAQIRIKMIKRQMYGRAAFLLLPSASCLPGEGPLPSRNEDQIQIQYSGSVDSVSTIEAVAGDAAPGDSLSTSLGRVRSRWAWLTLALSLFTYGLGSFLQHEIEPFLSVWQIAWVTLPLTLAVAGIAFLLFIRKLTFWRTIGIIFGTFLASLITGSTAGKRVNAYLAVTLRHWAGPKDCTKLGYGLPDFCLPDYSAGHLVVSHPHQHFPVVDLVVAYTQLYGWIGSLKAVLVGGFVGYVLVLMYRPILRARHTPAQAVRG